MGPYKIALMELRRQWHRSGIFIVNSGHANADWISQLNFVNFPLVVIGEYFCPKIGDFKSDSLFCS